MRGSVSAFQVAVIGGGVTGASAANHLAAAGFDTILLERGDFASGTSSRSSRLQHCGLTYFSPGRSLWNFLLNPRMAFEHIELARRAMRDRSRFIRATPERLRPIPFYTPLYRRDGIPAWKARLGFRLLEALDPGGVKLDFELLTPQQALREPALRYLRDKQDLAGVIRFTEYQFDWPERICLDTLLHAKDCGAEIRNYAEVTRIAPADSGGWQLTVGKDIITAECVINATGTWVDETAAQGGLSLRHVNQGLKGTNLAVRLPPEFRGLAIETALPDGNPFYVIPWRDIHYFGPRDEPTNPKPEGFRADEPTIAALIEDFHSALPGIPLTRADVLYSWAGVRPRTARAGHAEGCEAVLLHDMTDKAAAPYYAYTGGLIMTHRHAGASLAEAVAKRLRPARPPQAVRHAARLAAVNTEDPQIRSSDETTSAEHLRFCAEHEMVRHLDDLLFRRVPLGWSPMLGLDAAREAAEIVADILGWTEDDIDREVARYEALVACDFGKVQACA